MMKSNRQEVDTENVCQWIIQLSYPSTRENALIQLSQNRERIPDLAPMMWHSFGTVAALLQEITSVYPFINPPVLTVHQSNRVCNVLAIMQCIAVHPETKPAFLKSLIPIFLYPYLRTTSNETPFEYLRLTSLGVIGSLVKSDNEEVISFLISSKIIPLILKIMEDGSELPRTVATFIFQRILMAECGLIHVCETFDRFSHVTIILEKLVVSLKSQPSIRLLKHVVLCYLRLSENQQAKKALYQCLPDQFKNLTFGAWMEEDKYIKHWLQQLLKNLETQSGGLIAVERTKPTYFMNYRTDLALNNQVKSTNVLNQTGVF